MAQRAEGGENLELGEGRAVGWINLLELWLELSILAGGELQRSLSARDGGAHCGPQNRRHGKRAPASALLLQYLLPRLTTGQGKVQFNMGLFEDFLKHAFLWNHDVDTHDILVIHENSISLMRKRS